MESYQRTSKSVLRKQKAKEWSLRLRLFYEWFFAHFGLKLANIRLRLKKAFK